jgi:chromosome segregation ATPase
MKWIDKVLDDRNEGAIAFFWQLVGPLFILCTFALAPQNYFIFFAGVTGLFLSAKYRNTGFVISCMILVGTALMQHFYHYAFSLWEIGLEASYAMALFITAQSSARHQNLVKSLFSQLDTKDSVVLNLEDEFSKTRLEITRQQIQAQEKIDALQKQLDEIQSEQSSLLMLNEVLRKTTATHMNKKDSLTDELYQLQSRLSHEINEKESLKAKIANSDLSAHQQLVEELNAVRRDHQQAHTIKETLERLHTYEQQRAHAACEQLSVVEQERVQLLQKIAELEKERLNSQSQPNEQIENQLRQKIAHLEKELIEAQTHSTLEKEQISNQLHERIEQLEEELLTVQNQTTLEKEEVEKQFQQKLALLFERNAQLNSEKEHFSRLEAQLQQKMASFVEEIAQMQNMIDPLKQDLAEKEQAVISLEEKLKKVEGHSKVDLLYKQLRAQFDEKNEILHQTRSELFKLDNAYQALQIDITQMDFGVPRDIVIELQKEVNALQEENQNLQSIVTTLSESDSKVKKKPE